MVSLSDGEFPGVSRNTRSRHNLIFLSAIAFVSIPGTFSWNTYTPTLANFRCNSASCGAMNNLYRLKNSRPSRSLSSNGGCFHLRAQESPKTASDIAVLNERLWSAAELGDEQTIRTLLSVGAEVNSQPAIPVETAEDPKPPLPEPIFGPSALHLAAGNGKSKAVCALVELGAEVNSKDADLATPLHRAVIGGHLGEC